MAFRLRSSIVALSALSALGLAGCDWGSTEPVSISLQFNQDHTLNSDGSCRVQYVVQAFGFGTADWIRVVVRESGTVLQDYSGSETADFWGDTQISAGEQQTSTPFVAPDAAADVEIEVVYRLSGPERTLDLFPTCAADG